MRGEPNACGVVTKRAPTPHGYLSDLQFTTNCNQITVDLYRAFTAVQDGKVVVIPSDGLGTGLAELASYAPRTFEFLQSMLQALSKK